MTDDDALADLVDELRKLREENRELREQLENKDTKPDAPSNDEIVKGFFTAANYADSTERPYRNVIGYFREHIDDKPLCDVTQAEALDFALTWTGRDGDPLAASTMESYLNRVKKLYEWMCDQEWGPDENVVATARDTFKDQHSAQLRRSGQHTGTVLDPHEYTALLKWNRSPRIYALLLLAAKTGLRRKEIAFLQVEDVDIDSKKLYNRSPKGVDDDRLPKSDADQKLLDDETADAVAEWLDARSVEDSPWLFPNRQGNHVSPMTISRWWDKATNRAAGGVDDDALADDLNALTPHDARRCFTSWLNWNGCPRDVIKALRGDAEGDMVNLYTQYGEEVIREKYEDAMPILGTS